MNRPLQADLHTSSFPHDVLHATLALIGLVVATAPAIYKPRGMTQYGRRMQRLERHSYD